MINFIRASKKFAGSYGKLAVAVGIGFGIFTLTACDGLGNESSQSNLAAGVTGQSENFATELSVLNENAEQAVGQVQSIIGNAVTVLLGEYANGTFTADLSGKTAEYIVPVGAGVYQSGNRGGKNFSAQRDSEGGGSENPENAPHDSSGLDSETSAPPIMIEGNFPGNASDSNGTTPAGNRDEIPERSTNSNSPARGDGSQTAGDAQDYTSLAQGMTLRFYLEETEDGSQTVTAVEILSK